MSDFISPALEELKDLIEATWTDLEVQSEPDSRIFEAEHLAVIPFDLLTLPAAILVVETTPWLDGPLSRRDVFLDCSIYRVEKRPGKPGPLRTSLQTLRDAIGADPFSLSQVWDEPYPTVSWSLALDINRLLRGKKLPLLGGRVSCRLLTGEPS